MRATRGARRIVRDVSDLAIELGKGAFSLAQCIGNFVGFCM